MKILIISLLIALGASGAVAAEKSLPGDLLYPIKIHLNEKIVGGFTFGDEAGVNREVNLVDKRVKEIVTLNAQSDASVEAKSEAKVRLSDNVLKAKAGIINLNDKGLTQTADGIAIRLENILDAGIQNMDSGGLGGEGVLVEADGSLKNQLEIELEGVNVLQKTVIFPDGTVKESDGVENEGVIKNNDGVIKKPIKTIDNGIENNKSNDNYDSDSDVTFCTAEAKLCPDGKTYVGRIGPDCQFELCP